MIDYGPVPNPEHIPTITEKVIIKSGERIWGVICFQCSDREEDYIRCKYVKNYPEELKEEV